MAAKYFRNADGKYIKRDGAYMRAEDCCCEETPSCCEQEGGPPTADFSFTQTDDDPCTFQFTDESVPGDCGSIVAWLWDFGDGGSTSTEQNPSFSYTDALPEEGAGPWDVTLTVTDINGCTDSVVMSVDCEDMFVDCAPCTDRIPVTVQVALSGWGYQTFPDPAVSLPEYNTTHTLTHIGSCVWEKIGTNITRPGCIGEQFRITFFFQSGEFRVRVQPCWNTTPSTSQLYALTATTPCAGTHNLARTSGLATCCAATIITPSAPAVLTI